jgi:site-specific DNA-methyltransferase (adenine-specific)
MGDGFTYYRLYCFWDCPCSNNITVSAMNPYYSEDGITIYHGDCREILPTFPDKYFDLVLTDPPYGIGYEQTQNAQAISGRKSYRRGYWKSYPEYGWDVLDKEEVVVKLPSIGPTIIWGGNYYPLPTPSGWLVWNKVQRGFMSDGEMAWTNLTDKLKIYDLTRSDAYINHGEPKLHPTQKPGALIRWCIGLSKSATSILDPFMGSGTTLVAAKQLGRKAVGIEIEEKYCEIAVKRLAQMELFK